jgi:hypothetical protein
MVAFPAPIPRTMPLLSTVATDVLLERHVMFVGSIGLDGESKPLVVNFAESPCIMVSNGGEMVSKFTIGGEGSVPSDPSQPASAATATAYENPRNERAIAHSS